MRLVCAPEGTIFDARRPGQGVGDIVNAGFAETILDGLLCCKEREFKGMDKVRKDAAREKRPYIPDEPERIGEALKPLMDACREKGLAMSIARAPYLLRDRKSPELTEIYRKIAVEAVKLAVSAECEAVIVRPLFAGVPFGKEWDRNREFYVSLLPLLQGSATKILLENQCKDSEGHLIRGILSDPLEGVDWIDALNQEAGEERFGFCMDAGVYNLCGQDMYEAATTLGNRVKAVILRDNNGHDEDSLLPFTCISNYGQQTEWLGLIRGLREIQFDGYLIMDAKMTLDAVSPILRPTYMKLVKETADYFKWQIELESLMKKYEHVVLFGAGNMCRNYLINYGDKYPPLFTCDNNKDRWGEEFFGLTIHNPEDLKDLPEGTGIFICNVYYREIEAQLRGMGITNGIEYFNDEYLPALNMHRLKGL